ncbi:MAG: hypothetical protein KTR14_02340 [Vampirovibrio sp.]|nr:hypothetical protein [Vampirovibrio sp.]
MKPLSNASTILWLGPERPGLFAWLKTQGHNLVRTEEKISEDDPVLNNADIVVSYGYRHLIRPPVINRLPHRILNLHISYLPWNRGSDPNLWSFLENTLKGVTIHQVDSDLDTGSILAQREVPMDLEQDTLETSYKKLADAIETLFQEIWPDIIAGQIHPTPQIAGGSVHRLKDKEPYLPLLSQGWQTPVKDLMGKALAATASE